MANNYLQTFQVIDTLQSTNNNNSSSLERNLKGAFLKGRSIESVVDTSQLSAYKQQLVECIQLATSENQEAERRSAQITDSDSASNSETDSSETERDCDGDHHDKFVNACHPLMASSKAVSTIQSAEIAAAGGSDMPPSSVTPFLHAAENGQLGACAELAKKSGFNVNAVGQDHNTALHMACKNNHAEVVRLLLDLGADPCIRNMQSSDPLMVRCALQ